MDGQCPNEQNYTKTLAQQLEVLLVAPPEIPVKMPSLRANACEVAIDSGPGV